MKHLSHILTASFSFVEPLFHLPLEEKGKQIEPNTSRCDVFDDDCVAQLKEVLEMRIRVLAR